MSILTTKNTLIEGGRARSQLPSTVRLERKGRPTRKESAGAGAADAAKGPSTRPPPPKPLGQLCLCLSPPSNTRPHCTTTSTTTDHWMCFIVLSLRQHLCSDPSISFVSTCVRQRPCPAVSYPNHPHIHNPRHANTQPDSLGSFSHRDLLWPLSGLDANSVG